MDTEVPGGCQVDGQLDGQPAIVPRFEFVDSARTWKSEGGIIVRLLFWENGWGALESEEESIRKSNLVVALATGLALFALAGGR